MSEELKSCPFCGGLPIRGNGFAKILVCADCNAMGPTVPSSDMPADLVAARNTRVGEKE